MTRRTSPSGARTEIVGVQNQCPAQASIVTLLTRLENSISREPDLAVEAGDRLDRVVAGGRPRAVVGEAVPGELLQAAVGRQRHAAHQRARLRRGC